MGRGGKETTDRNACPRGRMSQRLIKSAGPEESRGALSWSSRAWEKASRFIDREGLQLAPRSPPAPCPLFSLLSLLVPADDLHYCFIKIESRGPTHARAPLSLRACLRQIAFPSNAIMRLAVKSKRIALFASRLI